MGCSRSNGTAIIGEDNLYRQKPPLQEKCAGCVSRCSLSFPTPEQLNYNHERFDLQIVGFTRHPNYLIGVLNNE